MLFFIREIVFKKSAPPVQTMFRSRSRVLRHLFGSLKGTGLVALPILIFLVLLFNGCSVNEGNEYFVIDYRPVVKNTGIPHRRSWPLPYRVSVRPIEMSRIYDRNVIVIRQSLHKMRFDETQKWASRPDEVVRALLIKHINQYEIFEECKKEYLDVRADFSINGRINNIEQYYSSSFAFASLDMDLYLRDAERKTLIHHKIIGREELKSPNTAFFVKVVSDMLKRETALFLKKIALYFENEQFRGASQ